MADALFADVRSIGNPSVPVLKVVCGFGFGVGRAVGRAFMVGAGVVPGGAPRHLTAPRLAFVSCQIAHSEHLLFAILSLYLPTSQYICFRLYTIK